MAECDRGIVRRPAAEERWAVLQTEARRGRVAEAEARPASDAQWQAARAEGLLAVREAVLWDIREALRDARAALWDIRAAARIRQE